MVDIQFALGVSKSHAHILVYLYEEKYVTCRGIENERKITKDAKVAIHRLRRRLEGTGIEIRSQREVGYWLDPSSKEKLKELADTGQQSFAFDQAKTSDAVLAGDV